MHDPHTLTDQVSARTVILSLLCAGNYRFLHIQAVTQCTNSFRKIFEMCDPELDPDFVPSFSCILANKLIQMTCSNALNSDDKNWHARAHTQRFLSRNSDTTSGSRNPPLKLNLVTLISPNSHWIWNGLSRLETKIKTQATYSVNTIPRRVQIERCHVHMCIWSDDDSKKKPDMPATNEHRLHQQLTFTICFRTHGDSKMAACVTNTLSITTTLNVTSVVISIFSRYKRQLKEISQMNIRFP